MRKEIHMCILHTMLVTPPATTKKCLVKQMYTFDFHSKMFIQFEMRVNLYVSHTHSKRRKLDVQIMFEPVYFSLHDIDRLQFNELNE